jgi:hypothetical protein
MNLRFLRYVAVLFACAPLACAAGSMAAPKAASAEMAPGEAAMGGMAAPAPMAPPSPPAAAQAMAPAKGAPADKEIRGGDKGGEVSVPRAPMLIYTADLTMAVYDVGPNLAKVEELAKQLGGYLARRDDRAITIRVPATRFEEAVKRVEAVGDVLHRNVVAEDVTEEFRDLEVRLKSLHAVRDRLEQLLQKAQKVEESVTIERELDRVSGEIDRIEGRMKFLRDRAAFSTITVSFQPRRTEEVQRSTFHLPIPWLSELGLGRLMSL